MLHRNIIRRNMATSSLPTIDKGVDYAMSALITPKRLTPRQIADRKGSAEPLVCLTAYTAPMAQLMDRHVDLLLVGDSLGMVLYGMDNTCAVTLDMMIAHGQAVMGGSQTACVVVDMPFGSYQESPAQAFRNAARVLAETGCGAVKLEGGAVMAETVAYLVERGIPVMGHVGLLPQSVNQLGGFRVQGRDEETAKDLFKDIEAIAAAGAFSIVVEGTVEAVAKELSARVPVPTIGIGASPECDGQILVTDDMLGLSGERIPSFVKRYANLREDISRAVAQYATEVRARQFPAPEHCYGNAKPAKKPAKL